MKTIFIFIFLFIFFTWFTKFFFKKTLDFIVSLNILDEIQYFLCVTFIFECIVFSFQKINLPYVSEYPIMFRFLLLIPVIGLITLFPVLDIMRNPEHEFRKQTIEIQKAKKLLEESKTLLNETMNWKISYMEILTKCNYEIEQIKTSDLSEEEKKIKEDEIIDKYNKEIEKLSNET